MAKMAKFRELTQKLWPASLADVPPLAGDAEAAGSGGEGKSDTYLEAIKALSSEMDGLASKADVEGAKSAVITQTKILIADAVHPIKDEYNALNARVTEIESQRGASTAPRTTSRCS